MNGACPRPKTSMSNMGSTGSLFNSPFIAKITDPRCESLVGPPGGPTMPVRGKMCDWKIGRLDLAGADSGRDFEKGPIHCEDFRVQVICE